MDENIVTAGSSESRERQIDESASQEASAPPNVTLPPLEAVSTSDIPTPIIGEGIDGEENPFARKSIMPSPPSLSLSLLSPYWMGFNLVNFVSM